MNSDTMHDSNTTGEKFENFGAQGETDPDDYDTSGMWAAHNPSNPQKYGCPYGYSCSSGLHTICGPLNWANW
jgi:hypothetical protein